MKRNDENGNALWFVLLAVALLAALTLAITRSSNTAEQNGSVESLRVQVSGLMQYAAAVGQTVQQMQMRDVSENQISFANSFASTGYNNANCANSGCLVFDKGGGGLTWQNPPPNANDGSPWLFTGTDAVTGVGETDNELLMILPNVNAALCARINTEQGITGIPQVGGGVDIATLYAGSFTGSHTIDAAPGKKAGCFQGNLDGSGGDISGNDYFYYTLIQR